MRVNMGHCRACADISIGGSVIVLPTLPPPTIPVVTGSDIYHDKCCSKHKQSQQAKTKSQQPHQQPRPQPLEIPQPQVRKISPGSNSQLGKLNFCQIELLEVPAKLVLPSEPGLETHPWQPGWVHLHNDSLQTFWSFSPRQKNQRLTVIVLQCCRNGGNMMNNPELWRCLTNIPKGASRTALLRHPSAPLTGWTSFCKTVLHDIVWKNELRKHV